MNTASLENCKKLYHLAGRSWEEPDYFYPQYDTNKYRTKAENANVHILQKQSIAVGIPAHDLGYLLRKLPKQHMSLAGSPAGVWFNPKIGKWICDYTIVNSSGNHKGNVIWADTPEDAACLLAIKLFEEGILKP